jgi:hypothetical protein
MLRRIVLPLAALCVACASPETVTTRAQADLAVDLDGKTVNLVVPSGYCALDEHNPEQSALIDRYYPADRSKFPPILLYRLRTHGSTGSGPFHDPIG